jgi:hypothetical protein
LVPIKWDIWLNISALKTDVRLIAKCCNRKTIKKIAERAIETFLAIDESKNSDISYIINKFITKVTLKKMLHKKKDLLRMILK